MHCAVKLHAPHARLLLWPDNLTQLCGGVWRPESDIESDFGGQRILRPELGLGLVL